MVWNKIPTSGPAATVFNRVGLERSMSKTSSSNHSTAAESRCSGELLTEGDNANPLALGYSQMDDHSDDWVDFDFANFGCDDAAGGLSSAANKTRKKKTAAAAGTSRNEHSHNHRLPPAGLYVDDEDNTLSATRSRMPRRRGLKPPSPSRMSCSPLRGGGRDNNDARGTSKNQVSMLPPGLWPRNSNDDNNHRASSTNEKDDVTCKPKSPHHKKRGGRGCPPATTEGDNSFASGVGAGNDENRPDGATIGSSPVGMTARAKAKFLRKISNKNGGGGGVVGTAGGNDRVPQYPHRRQSPSPTTRSRDHGISPPIHQGTTPNLSQCHTDGTQSASSDDSLGLQEVSRADRMDFRSITAEMVPPAAATASPIHQSPPTMMTTMQPMHPMAHPLNHHGVVVTPTLPGHLPPMPEDGGGACGGGYVPQSPAPDPIVKPLPPPRDADDELPLQSPPQTRPRPQLQRSQPQEVGGENSPGAGAHHKPQQQSRPPPPRVGMLQRSAVPSSKATSLCIPNDKGPPPNQLLRHRPSQQQQQHPRKQQQSPVAKPNQSVPGTWYYSSNHILINEERHSRNLPTLRRSGLLDAEARKAAQTMSDRRRLLHSDMDALAKLLRIEIKPGERISVLGENVGCGRSIREVHAKFMKNMVDRANMLDGRFVEMGIGTAKCEAGEDGDEQRLYVCQLFRG